MGTAERRNAILRVLCRRRHESMQNLAAEFAVSVRTIRRDIEILSAHYPLYTQTGRYMGGVYVLGDFSMDRMYMSDEEIEVLQKLSYLTDADDSILTYDEKHRLQSIISLYSKPKIQKGKK